MERKDVGRVIKKTLLNRTTAATATVGSLSLAIYAGFMHSPFVGAESNTREQGIIRNVITQKQQLLALEPAECVVNEACTDKRSFLIVPENNTVVVDVCDDDKQVVQCVEKEIPVSKEAAVKFRSILNEQGEVPVEVKIDDVQLPAPEQLHQRR